MATSGVALSTAWSSGRDVPPAGSGSRARDRLQEIGDDLQDHVRLLGLKLELQIVWSNFEDLGLEDFSLEEGGAVVVNSILQLHRVVKESRGALNSVLQVVYRLSPKTVAVVEQDSSLNGPFFLGRFMEALHYYSANFDSLDAAQPRYDRGGRR
ncbi:hypothetical protein MLD38_008455 [Melastoma candidum]|uniref:Uncharacterized protein n=1 Tax=Melastoma candidum TaxID=119954 RepID=A0ACB9RU03_9MYRT|nr:hypothetical protein MLD38_008455 [Melastoma candidum]